MPKTSYLKTKTNRLDNALRAMDGVASMFRLKCPSDRSFAEVLGMAPATAGKRLRQPGELCMEEIIRASVELGYEGSLTLKNGDISMEVSW